MDKQPPYFKEVNWEEVRNDVKKVNAQLTDIIDNIDPDKRYPLIKVSYKFGDFIVKDGVTYLPDRNSDLLPIDDKRVQEVLKNKLTYSNVPLFLILKNACEVFIHSSSRAVPLNLFYPGDFLGLFETMDFLYHRKSSPNWCVSAGARNLFTLCKINEASGFKRLKAAYKLASHLQPRFLSDHWHIFREIAQHHDFEQDWHCEVIFFTKSWITNHYHDKAWAAFKNYLAKEAWHQAQFAINKISLNSTWEHFSTAIAARNLKPIPYLVDHVKHLLLIAVGRWPGLRAADQSEQAAPVYGIQKAVTDIYQLKKYIPTIMHVSSIERDVDIPIYYSLSYPTLLEGAPQSTTAYTTMVDLRKIKLLIDTIAPLFTDTKKADAYLFQKVIFDYFHVEKDTYEEICSSKVIPEKDLLISYEQGKFPEREFCATSQFWRGCIRILHKAENL